jgi:hypothetical protein
VKEKQYKQRDICMASPGLDFGTCVRELWVVLAPAQNFNRRISAEEALILATAGDGSKTDGFRNLLSLYGELHNIGFRSHMSLQDFPDINTKASGSNTEPINLLAVLKNHASNIHHKIFYFL